MSDPASQANELRLLEQKRLRNGLSHEEEARRLALQDAVPASPRRGFDVNAAAAEVRALLDRAEPPEPRPALLEAEARAAETPAVAQPQAWSAATPFTPSVAAGPARESEGPAVAPVYDAAAYGLDPNDPNAVAWAAWYAEQGWDPATAYAYAQQMNAAAEQDGGIPLAPPEASAVLDATADPEEASAMPDAAVAPDDPIGVLDAVAAHDEAIAVLDTAAPPEEAIALPDSAATPDEEIGMPDAVAARDEAIAVLDEPADAPLSTLGEAPVEHAGTLVQDDAAPPAGHSEDLVPDLPPLALEALDGSVPGQEPAAVQEQDVPIDLGPAFEAEATARDEAPPDRVASPLGGLASAALPTELGWAEHAVPASDEPVDFSAFDAEPAAVAAPPMTRGAGPDDSLELPPPEPLEVGDDDILEVGEDVMEVVEGTESPAAAPPEPEPVPAADLAPAPALELSPIPDFPPEPEEPPASRIELLAAGPAEEVASPDPVEPTLAFGAIVPESRGGDLGPAHGAGDWSVPAAASCEPEPPTPPESYVSGTHRVVVHTADGQVRRGTVTDVALDSGELLLAPQGGRAEERIPVEQIKAIFFMLPHGHPAAEPAGKKVRVTFRDGRQVAGFSADYAPGRPGFFMVPADTRTHTARIWVYRSAVRQVSVS